MRKSISILLMFALTFSSFAFAFADSNIVHIINAEGEETWLAERNPITLMEFRTKVPDKVSISVGGEEKAAFSDFSKDNTVTLPGGTLVTVYTKAESGIKTLYLKYNQLKDSFDVKVSAKDAEFTARANSGIYGKDGNIGGASTANITEGSAVQVLNGVSGYAYSVRFEPLPGQEMAGVNIRLDASDAKGQVATDLNSTVTLNGMKFTLKGGTDGVTVSSSEVFGNVFITGLTKDAVKRHSFTATTEIGTAKVSAANVEDKTSASATFTAPSGKLIGDIEITSGGKTVTLAYDKTSVSVNGMSFSRSGSGNTVTLSTSSFSAAVSVKAKELTGYVKVEVNEGKYADSPQNGTNLVEIGKDFKVVFASDDYADMTDLIVYKDGAKYTAGIYSSRIVVDGYSYRMHYNGESVTLYLEDVQANMEVTVGASADSYKVTVKADTGFFNQNTSYRAKADEDLTVRFTPYGGSTVKKVVIDYLGVKNTVYPSDSYVRIGGVRHPISEDAGGMVITIRGLEDDITFTATSSDGTAWADENDWVALSEDAHSNLSLNKTSIDKYDDYVVRASADRNYEIAYVDVSTKTDSARIYWDDKKFSLDGRSYSVSYSGSQMRINLTAYKPVTVKAVSVAEGASITPITQSGYHAAYIAGYTDGSFKPERPLTRAEAITMLSRLFANGHSTPSCTFSDVNTSDWFYSDIAYAQKMGYTNVLTSTNYVMPNAPITRAEYVALLIQYSGIRVPQSISYTGFSDVSNDYYLAKYIASAKLNGLAEGFPDGTFRPANDLTRAQAVAFTNRALGRAYCPASAYPYPVFNDVSANHWAARDIFEAAVAHEEY